MKTTFIKGIAPLALVLVVAFLVVVGGGIYYTTQNNGSDEKNEEEGAMMEENDESAFTEGSSRTSLRALLALGRDITCTFERVDGSEKVSGVVYMSGDDMRGDFDLESEVTGKVTTHMIRDGEFAYVWSDGISQGSKLRIDDKEQESKEESEKTVDLDEEVDYDCSRWGRDSSKFSVPSGIDFVDVSAMMELQMEAEGQIQGNQCAACDQIPDPNAKAQCLKSLGC